MKWQRILSVVAVFPAISGSMLGSEPEKPLRVRWSELKKLVDGKKVTLQLAEGARVGGRIRKVTAASLTFKVKKSSDPADYPKGKIQIRRETISRIEVSRKTKEGGLGRLWERPQEPILEACWLWSEKQLARANQASRK